MTPSVLGASDGLKVVRVDACLDDTQVIQDQPRGDGAAMLFVDPAVGSKVASTAPNSPIASLQEGPIPDPAGRGEPSVLHAVQRTRVSGHAARCDSGTPFWREHHASAHPGKGRSVGCAQGTTPQGCRTLLSDSGIPKLVTTDKAASDWDLPTPTRTRIHLPIKSKRTS